MLLLHFILVSIFSANLASCAAIASLPGKWTSLANITTYPRQEHTTVLVNDEEIYIIGGIVDELDGQSLPTVTLVQRYSVSKNTWEFVAPFPLAINHPNAAVVEGKIYVLGALTPLDGNWWATNISAVYDPAVNTWTLLDDIPAGRAIGSAAVGVHGKNIYLAGGLNNTLFAGDQEGTVDLFTSYNVETKKWTVHADLPLPRDHAGVGLVNGKLYVLGGRAYGHNNTVDTVFSYDLHTGKWTTGLATMPTARGSVSSTVVATWIYTFGGEGNQESPIGIFNQSEVYDTVNNVWHKLAPMDLPRHGTQAVSIGKKIYIPGGGLTTGALPTEFFSYFEL